MIGDQHLSVPLFPPHPVPNRNQQYILRGSAQISTPPHSPPPPRAAFPAVVGWGGATAAAVFPSQETFPLLTFYETFLGRVLGAHQWAGEGGKRGFKGFELFRDEEREGGADRPRFWTRIHPRGCGSKVDPPAINTNPSNASPPRVDPFPSPLQLPRRRRRPIKLG